MCVCGPLDFIGMGFPNVKLLFRLFLPFLDSHGVVGSLVLVELDFQMDSKLSGVVSGLFTRPRNPGMRYTVKLGCEALD